MTTPETPEREAVLSARAARKARRESERERQRLAAAQRRPPREVRISVDLVRHHDWQGIKETHTSNKIADEVHFQSSSGGDRTIVEVATYADGSGSVSIRRDGGTIESFSWPSEINPTT